MDVIEGGIDLAALGLPSEALFMPALVAKRHNPLLRAFAERLARNGKDHGAILGAVAHKLLRILIGLLRHHHDFDPNWHSLHHA